MVFEAFGQWDKSRNIQPDSPEEKILMEGPVSGLPKPQFDSAEDELRLSELCNQVREYAIKRLDYGESWWQDVLDLMPDELARFLEREKCRTMREAIAACEAEHKPLGFVHGPDYDTRWEEGR